MNLWNRKQGDGPSRGARRFGQGVALACAVVLPAIGEAQSGEGPLVLRLPVSARSLAMGNANLAINDADALFANPGMLVYARGASVSMQRYGSAATTGSAAAITTVGSLTIAVGAQSLDWQAPGRSYGDLMKTGATSLSDGGVVNATSQVAAIGFGRTFKGLRFGASAKYAQERIGAFSDGTVALDVGVARPFGPATLTVTAQNLGGGPRLAGEEGMLPRRFGIGWGGGMFQAGEHFDLGMQTQLTVEGDGFVRPAGGIEVGYVPIEGVALVWRQGLRLPREKDESLVTGGLGVTVDRFSLDYAVEPMRGGRPVSHRIGIRLK